MKTYRTHGSCASAIHYEVENGILTALRFEGGCRGNTQGICKLAVGRPIAEIAELLSGIPCRGGTSCPDQLARALRAELAQE